MRSFILSRPSLSFAWHKRGLDHNWAPPQAADLNVWLIHQLFIELPYHAPSIILLLSCIYSAASGKLTAVQQGITLFSLNFAWLPAEACVDSRLRRRMSGAGVPAPSGRGGHDGTQDEAQCARRHHLLRLLDCNCRRHVLILGASPRAFRNNGPSIGQP